jgi:hypothetical protein
VQRQVLYLGEINDSQRESWCRVIEAFDERPNNELHQMKFHTNQTLLLKLRAAKGKYPATWRLIDIAMPKSQSRSTHVTFSFQLDRQKLAEARRREGRYLLRTNLPGKDPAQLWQLYIQLVEIEAAFKNLKPNVVETF